MAEIFLSKGENTTLVPADSLSRKMVEKWKLGKGFKVTIKRVRHIQNHRRLFALIQVVTEYSDVYDTTPKALDAIKIAAGHVDWILSPVTGEMCPLPKSISFENMDEDEFGLFYNDAVNGVLKYILPGTMDEKSLNEAVDIVVRF